MWYSLCARPGNHLNCRAYFQYRVLACVAFLAILTIGPSSQIAAAASPPLPQSENPSAPDNEMHDLYLPQIVTDDTGTSGECQSASDALFTSVPVAGPPTDRPPSVHADLNLSVRGYSRISQSLTLVDINGQADPNAPQLAGITGGDRRPRFVKAYQVNQWDWSCQGDVSEPWAGHGCRGDPITSPPVTLLALAAHPGAPIRTPSRNAEIYGGGPVALVLYAEEQRLTLVYTREDTVAFGYVIHLEDFCVDPALLSMYRELDAAGRSWLPALHSLEQIGSAGAKPLKVAVRDSGSFMDPRSRKDWWKGY